MRTLLSLIWLNVKRYPWQWTLLSILLLLLAGLWVADPLYSSYAVDRLTAIGQGKEVNYVLLFGVWAIIFFSMSIVQAYEKFLEWKLGMHLELDFVQRAYHHVLKLPANFHVQQRAGESMKAIDEGGTELAYLQRIVLDLLPSIVSSLVFLIISFVIQPLLAIILLVTLILYSSIVVFGSIKTAALQQKANKAWVKPTGRAFDAITNIFTVKSSAREDDELKRMRRGHGQVMKYQLMVNRRWAFIEGMNFFMLARILLIGIGIILLAKGLLTLGEVYYFQLSFFRVLVPFEILANALPTWNKSVGKVKLAQSLFTIDEEAQGQKSKTPAKLKGAITFDHVTFTYGPQAFSILTDEEDEETAEILEERIPGQLEDIVPAPPIESHYEEDLKSPEPEDRESLGEMEEPAVLRDLVLEVKAGEQIALVGHSGAGKSTIAMLLNRFYDPTKGKILVDGIDLKNIDIHWWRRNIGMVLQENVMFNDTLLDNIRYGRPNASEKEVIEAAKRASAHEFIMRMPGKYKTIVGERGIKLSGGERQRIAIARAILKKPTIVILDEATSALDSITERAVQEGIKELIKGRTSFIIAHRLSTVRSVDRIAVMDKGRLVACAPHEKLLTISPIYRKMIDLQKEGKLPD